MLSTEHSSTEPPRLRPPAWLGSVLGVLWFTAMEFVIFSLDHRVFLSMGLGLAAVVLLILAITQVRSTLPHRRRSTGALGSLLIAISSAGVVIFAGGLTSVTSGLLRQLPAHAMAIIGAALLTAWWHHQERQVVDLLRGRFAAFVMTVVVWGFGLSALSWIIFLGLPIWQFLVVTVVATCLASLVVWSDAGVQWPTIWRALVPTAVIATEVWMVAWWLPTSVLVGTTVATTIAILYIQVARHQWLKTWNPGRGRRYLMIGLVVALLTLLSARWV